MNVRELITELLDCDLNAEVSIEFVTDGESADEQQFFIEETGLSSNGYVSLVHESKNLELIEKEDLQDLKERIEELEENK